jgi:hypothetical protein
VAPLPRNCVRAAKLLIIVVRSIRKRWDLRITHQEPIFCTYLFRLQDWRSHKEYCRKVKAAGANTFDAILFAPDETKPRLVKIPWKLIPPDDDEPGSYHNLDTDIWFKHPEKFIRTMFFHQLGINYGPELGRLLGFLYDDNFLPNGAPLNRCIENVTGGKAGRRWHGNILGLRMEGYSYDLYASVDMEEDLKPFLVWFEECHKFRSALESTV